MAVGAHPSDELQQMSVIAGQVAPMDRLVMRDPVPEEVKALRAVRHVTPNLPRVTWRWVSHERGRNGGHPQRCQVGRFGQVSPESETQLGDDLAMHFPAFASPGCASASVVDVLSGSGRMSAWEQVHTPIPDVFPSLSRAVSHERIVDPIAKDDLETAEVFVKGGACAGVPVVQVDSGVWVAATRLEVRPEPVQREAIGYDLVIDP